MQKGVAHWRWVGEPLGRLFVRTERNLLVLSDSVVTISPDFVRTLSEWGLSTERISVIENWAPLEELPHRSRQSSWSTTHGLADKTTFLYSGTLGRKHDPTLLLELAVRFRHRPDVVLVVISEGQAAEWLAVQKESLALDNLVLLPFQPYDALPDVLGSADVLVVILERDAGVFSVPSKVLTYQCAGRPLLAAVPPENLAGRIIAESECGLVFDSDDREGFLAAAEKLAADEDLRIRLGRNGRTYAEATFDIGVIADRFETVLAHVAASSFSRERPTTKLRPNG
jgi:glycosyltransferase involved in cell wall biosynthesis